MNALKSPALLTGLNLSAVLFWLVAAVAKLADHDNFVRQLSSLTGSKGVALSLSFIFPVVAFVIALVLVLTIGHHGRPRYLASILSCVALCAMTSLFLYIDLAKPMGVCACLALSKGLEWQGSWIVSGLVTVLNITSVAIQRRQSFLIQ